MKMLKLLGLFAVPTVAFALAGCDVDVKDEGELPKVDVQTEPGEMPDVDVQGPDVDVSTDKKEVTVPDVDVETEKKEVTVPDVDVDIPKEKDTPQDQ